MQEEYMGDGGGYLGDTSFVQERSCEGWDALF